MTPYETRMIELMERLEATLAEIRDHLRAAPGSASQDGAVVEAFADEAFRDRDA